MGEGDATGSVTTMVLLGGVGGAAAGPAAGGVLTAGVDVVFAGVGGLGAATAAAVSQDVMQLQQLASR